MTAAMVTQTNPYMDSKNPISAAGPSNSQTDFSEVFKKSAAADIQKPEVKEQPDRQKDVKNADREEPAGKKDDISEQQSQKVEDDKDITSKEPLREETSEDVEDIQDTAIEEVLNSIEEVLLAIQNAMNVSTEDVQSAMKTLGMQNEDLLIPDNISKLVLTLQGTDEVALMTDEQLFKDVKELTQTADMQLQSLSDSLGIPVEDVKQVLDQLKNMSKDVPAVEMSTDEQPLISKAETETLQPVEIKVDKNLMKQNENGTGKNETGEFNFAQNVLEQLKTAVGKTQDVTPFSYSTSTESIMDQVSEALKVTMKEDMTEMELELHPASLGNVRVQVASKEGIITASFTTQNETVKAALESQIMILKDNLDEQGIKVEAVEVTVSSHAFERNLNEEGEHSSNEAETRKKSVRKINLSDIQGTSEEEMTQEDAIVADMMRKNGNTVDYTA